MISIFPLSEITKHQMDDSVTTKLLTLLNISATKVGKHKRTYEDHLCSSDKLNKRKTASFAEPRSEPDDISAKTGVESVVVGAAAQEEVEIVNKEDDPSMCIQDAILVTLFDYVQSLAAPMKSTLAITLLFLLTL